MPGQPLNFLDRPVKISYRSKTRISIRIAPDLTILVSAPPRTPHSRIQTLLEEQNQWIEKQLESYKTIQDQFPSLTFQDQSQIMFQGQPFTLSLHHSEITTAPFIEHQSIHIHAPKHTLNQTRSEVIKMLQTMFSGYLHDWTHPYRQCFKQPITSITIKDLKSRWGSCSTNGQLTFNWRLMIAPPSVGRYVAIHECCHLEHMNHSSEFWELVASLDPTYKESKQWLKTYGHFLLNYI